ncbi:MAG TPA: 23S rRNA (uracil(1939)-C(5))-methyltransferase RlmD [bacterium]|nr:23S rRNA (uracil(1939)-C(5))-methyltransferase RlmD [bacterium]
MHLRPADEVDVRVDRLSYGGRGVGRLDGFVVFVDDAAPGDLLRVRLRKVKRSYAEAAPVRLLEPSPERVAPRCPHFGSCGGCLWQHLAYDAQLRAKQAIVEESLRHLGGLTPAVRPIEGADPWYYRNKMEFSFHPGGRLGLHRRGRWDEIEDLTTCFLQSPRTVEIVNAVRAFVRRHDIACYDPRTHEGVLRHLVIREGRATGELLIAVVTASETFPQARELAALLVDRHPELTGFLWAINPSRGDAVEVAGVHVLHGRPYITERVGGITFRLGLLTFFQTNTAQAERMVAIVRELAGAAMGHVLDLYCGVGTFGLALAGRARRVTGIEVVAASVEAARENAALNGITNATFHAADVRGFDRLPGVADVDLLVLDPPRAGAGARVMQAIARLAPPRVIYISCNPTTLAPDLRELVGAGYAVRVVQPIDLFPQTYHVECVVLLERATS